MHAARRVLDGLLALRGRVVAGALALAGCGLGAGPAPSAVQLTVTRDFGAACRCSRTAAPKVKGAGDGDEPADAQRQAVTTHYGGGFVQSIDGLSGGQEAGGDPVDWFYYVNGSRPPRARRRRTCIRAITSGGTCTTGARPTTSPRWSGRFPSRS